jgi:hypothetical protein
LITCTVCGEAVVPQGTAPKLTAFGERLIATGGPDGGVTVLSGVPASATVESGAPASVPGGVDVGVVVGVGVGVPESLSFVARTPGFSFDELHWSVAVAKKTVSPTKAQRLDI